MQQYYAIIHPTTNKLIEFSEFSKLEMVTITGVNAEGRYEVTSIPALCIGPIDYDVDLFSKTYNPQTEQFV